MDFIFNEYPFLVPPIAAAAFLFAVWVDFSRIKRRDTAVATFAFGLLPIVGSIFYLNASLLLAAVALISMIVYVGVFWMMLARYKDQTKEGDEPKRS